MTSLASTRAHRGRIVTVATVVLAALAVAGSVSAALTVDLAGRLMPAAARTQGTKLILLGADTGTDAAPRSLVPGFLLSQGRYSTIEAPGATVETGATGINNLGQIVGGIHSGSPDHGFVRDAPSRFTIIKFPGARSTAAQKINDRGQITGFFSTTGDDARQSPTGFLLSRGRFTRIAVPGAVTTTAVGINNRGQVVGQYQDTDGIFHGYVWDKGRFTTIDAPGATDTSATDINDRGQITGALAEPDGTLRGFVLQRGRYTPFSAPGAAFTAPFDINNRGQIAGFTMSTDGSTASGFLATGVNGPFTTISFPGAPTTLAFGLNDSGQIVGTYNNPNATISPPQDSSPPVDMSQAKR